MQKPEISSINAMSDTISRNRQKILLVLYLLYLFSFFYLVVTLLLPVLKQSARFRDILPDIPGNTVLIGGYFAGLSLITILIFTVKKAGRIVSVLMILVILAGAMYINRYNRLYNVLIRYPPYIESNSSNLAYLAQKRWKRPIPFDFFYSLGEKYYLRTIIANPNLRNLANLKKLDRFGLGLIISKEVQPQLNNSQIATLKITPN